MGFTRPTLHPETNYMTWLAGNEDYQRDSFDVSFVCTGRPGSLSPLDQDLCHSSTASPVKFDFCDCIPPASELELRLIALGVS